MAYGLKGTNQFKKDLALLRKQIRRFDILVEIILGLSVDAKVDPKYKPHKLKGNLNNFMECHIENDWLLIYEVNENKKIVSLTRIGSHSELFKK